MRGVVATSIKSILTIDAFEDGFFAVKENEFDILGSFVFFGKNAGDFDEYSGGRSAVVDTEKFKFSVKLGVEMGA